MILVVIFLCGKMRGAWGTGSVSRGVDILIDAGVGGTGSVGLRPSVCVWNGWVFGGGRRGRRPLGASASGRRFMRTIR